MCGRAVPADIWKSLHGILCVHKPRDVSLSALKRFLISAICESANKRCSPVEVPEIEMPVVEPHPKSQAPVVVGLRKQPDYNFHPLVVGQPFRKEDIRVEELDYQQPAGSGICLLGINDGCNTLESLRDRVWVNEYVLQGQLGRGTVQNKIRGKVNRKCDYEHITYRNISRFLLRLQAHYKKIAFKLANVDLESQEAFELACKGLPRPKVLDAPVIYFIKLLHFNSPHFKISLHCVCKNDDFLQDFVNEIALSLGSVASCRQLIRTRLGPFGFMHSLLDKHFTLKNVLKNMRLCRKIIEHDEKTLDKEVIKTTAELDLRDVLEDEFIEMLDEEEECETVEDCLRIPWGRTYD
uniref:Pseudouridine synthase II N-terminal domain-containing protein n=1 Tax=Setaria digitata TaxID=48799 RepID=A0A915PKX4_9BILA